MTCDLTSVKSELLHRCEGLLEHLLDTCSSDATKPGEVEVQVWKFAMSMGRAVLTALFAVLCARRTEEAVSRLGLSPRDVRFRLDADYEGRLNTTFGRVAFPWYAFRDPAGRTHTPARSLFPNHPAIRSSELLLEWECALAADHPFRRAADALLFFSHGAADVEDTTIERHALAVGSAIPVDWLYQRPEEIRKVLLEQATRDAQTGRPIVYASTDAHALKRFVDDTWSPKWKMTNGIRLWCIDKKSDAIIHLGGEYTWGDCMDVRARFERLQGSGHLPKDGDYGGGVVAAVALVTDGLDWIAEHILPLFPTAELILDPYHVVQQVADGASKLYPGTKGKRKVAGILARARRAIGMRPRRERTKYRKGPNRTRYKRTGTGLDGDGQRLLDDVLLPLKNTLAKANKRLDTLIDYVRRNLHRLHYGDLRRRGFQIGSGAMESIHRTGSQLRLKRAGCNWTQEVSQAILNLRMLALSGRWAEFWSTPPQLHVQPRDQVV